MKQTAYFLALILLISSLAACAATPPAELPDTTDTADTESSREIADTDAPAQTLPEGFSSRTIRFLYDMGDGALSEVALDIVLPDDWTVSYGYGKYEVPPYEAYATFRQNDDPVGSIGFLQYELPEGDDLPVQAIFSQIAMGSVMMWNIHQHFDVVTADEFPYCTALTSVLYAAKLFPDGQERQNSGIVTYHPENRMYFALELMDGYKGRQLLTAEQLRLVAESMTWRPLTGTAMTEEGIAAAVLKKGGDVVLPDAVTAITASTITAAQPFDQPVTSIRFGKNVTAFTGVDIDTLENLYVQENDPAYVSVDGVIYSRDRAQLVAFPAGRDGVFTVPEGVTAIADGAFLCTRLTEVILPDSVVSVGENAFADSVTVRRVSDG